MDAAAGVLAVRPVAGRLIVASSPLDSRPMDLSDFVCLAREKPALPFLVIGGYAVAAHGYARATFDVDFLARRADREVWITRLTAAGLRQVGDTRSFVRFGLPGGGDALDLMFVDEDTFTGMVGAAEERDFGAAHALVPCLDHLLALKLHVLRQALAHRTSKDADDVEMLIRRNGLDLREPRYEQLFLRYGNREIYETFRRLARQR